MQLEYTKSFTVYEIWGFSVITIIFRNKMRMSIGAKTTVHISSASFGIYYFKLLKLQNTFI